MEKREWHAIDVESVLETLGTTRKGISDREASERLGKFGPNELTEEKKVTPFELFVGQFKSILVVILIISAVVSAYLAIQEGEPMTDAWVILIIVIMNAVLGFVQEYRAEKAVEALKAMVSPHVLVLRDTTEKSIDSKDLVPGDIVLLDAGSRIPADCRLIEAANLQVDEAALTGESRPVTKNLNLVQSDVGVGDRKNMIYMGTVVTGGRAVAVVTGTGMSSEFGKIAGMVQSIDVEDPPLRIKMEKMGRQLAAISVVLTVWVFIILWFVHDRTLGEVFMTSISLAVSAIPEGLPAVLTITLTLGTARMARHKAIVRRLASVETLGSTTVICSDKTGTLTKNEMTVVKISSNGRIINVTGAGYTPIGEFHINDENILPKDDNDLELLLRIGTLNNDAHLQEDGESWICFGDPTEGAFVVAAEKAGMPQIELKETYPRVSEIPFDSTRKRMTTVHRTPKGKLVAYVKGAPEIILERSRNVYDGKVRAIQQDDVEVNLDTMTQMAESALRVLAMGYKELPDDYDLHSSLSGSSGRCG